MVGLIAQNSTGEFHMKRLQTLVLSKEDAEKVQLGRSYHCIAKPVFERLGNRIGILVEVSSVLPNQDPLVRAIRKIEP